MFGSLALWQAKKWAAAWQNQQNCVRPAKTQISLGIWPVWSVFAVRMNKAWVLSYLLNVSEGSDQTGQMTRLIPAFARRTCHFVGFVVRRLKFPVLGWTWFYAAVLAYTEYSKKIKSSLPLLSWTSLYWCACVTNIILLTFITAFKTWLAIYTDLVTESLTSI